MMTRTLRGLRRPDHARDRGRAADPRIAAPGIAAIAAALGLLAAAIPAAGQPAAPSTVTSPPSDHDAYLQRVQAEMDGWRLKMRGMADQAEATRQETATTAKSELRAAWSRTEEGARNLQTASAAGWNDAKSSFERASQDLQHAWDKTLL